MKKPISFEEALSKMRCKASYTEIGLTEDGRLMFSTSSGIFATTQNYTIISGSEIFASINDLTGLRTFFTAPLPPKGTPLLGYTNKHMLTRLPSGNYELLKQGERPEPDTLTIIVASSAVLKSKEDEAYIHNIHLVIVDGQIPEAPVIMHAPFNEREWASYNSLVISTAVRHCPDKSREFKDFLVNADKSSALPSIASETLSAEEVTNNG